MQRMQRVMSEPALQWSGVRENHRATDAEICICLCICKTTYGRTLVQLCGRSAAARKLRRPKLDRDAFEEELELCGGLRLP
jgi:hypothetical protein